MGNQIFCCYRNSIYMKVKKMELRNLQYLEAVYRLHSFTKAADEFYISQPSITGAIQKLEKELGVMLIDRSKKPFQFTVNGEHFMKHVYNILGVVGDAEKDMKKTQGMETEHINLVWASTMGDCLLPLVFTEFYEKNPHYQITLYEQTNAEILEGLQNETYDLAYALFPEQYNPDIVKTIPVQICQMYVIMSKQCELKRYNKIPLEALKEKKILSFPKGSAVRTKIDDLFHKARIVPEIQTIRQTKLIEELICQNYGIAILPLDKVNSVATEEEIIIRPLKDSIVFTKGFIMKRGRHRTDGMKALIRFVQERV